MQIPATYGHINACTHDYHYMTQSVQDLTDSTQQNTLHSMEANASLFADDTDTHCDFSITDHTLDTENTNDTHTCLTPKYPTIHTKYEVPMANPVARRGVHLLYKALWLLINQMSQKQ